MNGYSAERRSRVISLEHFRCLPPLAGIVIALLIAVTGCSTRVVLTSRPPGAEVWLLGEQKGVTDFEMRMKGGRHRPAHFVFKKLGFQERREPKVVTGDEVVVHASLERLHTSVSVETLPRGATVTLTSNGKRVHPGSIEDDELWGDRKDLVLKIEVKAQWYEPQARDVVVPRGTRNIFSFVLLPVPPRLLINSNPSGAKVYERTLGYLGITPLRETLTIEDLVATSGQLELTVRRTKGGILHGGQTNVDIDPSQEEIPISVDLDPIE